MPLSRIIDQWMIVGTLGTFPIAELCPFGLSAAGTQSLAHFATPAESRTDPE
jgi:hypothetical protein